MAPRVSRYAFQPATRRALRHLLCGNDRKEDFVSGVLRDTRRVAEQAEGVRRYSADGSGSEVWGAGEVGCATKIVRSKCGSDEIVAIASHRIHRPSIHPLSSTGMLCSCPSRASRDAIGAGASARLCSRRASRHASQPVSQPLCECD